MAYALRSLGHSKRRHSAPPSNLPRHRRLRAQGHEGNRRQNGEIRQTHGRALSIQRRSSLRPTFRLRFQRLGYQRGRGFGH